MFAILEILTYDVTPCWYLKGLYKEEEWLKLNANEFKWRLQWQVQECACLDGFLK